MTSETHHPIEILMVEDNPDDAFLIQEMLAEARSAIGRFEVTHVERLAAGLECMAQGDVDVVLLDLGLPDSQGLETFAATHARAGKVPIVILSGLDDEAQAIEAVERGAWDYLVKGQVEGRSLVRVLRYAIGRKRAEEAVRASEGRYRDLFDNALNGVALHEIVTDAEGQAVDYVFLDVNPAFEEQTGLSAADIVGRRVTQVLPGIENTTFIEIYGQVALTGEPVHFEQFSPQLDRHYAIAAFSPRKGQFATAFSDITESVRAREALRQHSEQLEELVEERTKALQEAHEQLISQEQLAVLGQLAGGVGHELRNPLGVIKNVAYLLHQLLSDPDPGFREALDTLDRGVESADRVIRALLDFARTKLPSRREVSLNDVVREALSRVTAPDSVSVRCELDETLPPILADPDQLGQVCSNLIDNAIQAMPEGGRLVVKTTRRSHTEVDISVADTGMGIPEENLERVFEPLSTTKVTGIGLGLALVRTFVEAHGGTVEV